MINKKEQQILSKFEKDFNSKLNKIFLKAEKMKFPKSSVAYTNLYNEKIKFHQAINKALEYCLKKDKKMILYGLGVSDPKEIFDTTINLQKFGAHRVFDIPNSENALTGMGIGYGMMGGRVVMTHQRLDFSLLSLDQLINNAAKLFYTSDGKFSVPITIRLIIGRGWGQGPNHSQALQSLLHIFLDLK